MNIFDNLFLLDNELIKNQGEIQKFNYYNNIFIMNTIQKIQPLEILYHDVIMKKIDPYICLRCEENEENNSVKFKNVNFRLCEYHLPHGLLYIQQILNFVNVGTDLTYKNNKKNIEKIRRNFDNVKQIILDEVYEINKKLTKKIDIFGILSEEEKIKVSRIIKNTLSLIYYIFAETYHDFIVQSLKCLNQDGICDLIDILPNKFFTFRDISLISYVPEITIESHEDYITCILNQFLNYPSFPSLNDSGDKIFEHKCFSPVKKYFNIGVMVTPDEKNYFITVIKNNVNSQIKKILTEHDILFDSFEVSSVIVFKVNEIVEQFYKTLYEIPDHFHIHIPCLHIMERDQNEYKQLYNIFKVQNVNDELNEYYANFWSGPNLKFKIELFCKLNKNIFRLILNKLKPIHDMNIYHCNLNQYNVFVDNSYDVKIFSCKYSQNKYSSEFDENQFLNEYFHGKTIQLLNENGYQSKVDLYFDVLKTFDFFEDNSKKCLNLILNSDIQINKNIKIIHNIRKGG